MKGIHYTRARVRSEESKKWDDSSLNWAQQISRVEVKVEPEVSHVLGVGEGLHHGHHLVRVVHRDVGRVGSARLFPRLPDGKI